MAEIKLTSGDGTETPAQLQLVTRIPWKYGVTAQETATSWVLVRVQAFVSKALFAKAAQIVKLGSCVMGFAEPSHGKDVSCQLVGWDVVSLDDWRLQSQLTMPAQFDLISNRGHTFLSLFLVNMDNVFCLPQLSAVNFTYTRLPHVSHGVFCSGPIGGTYAVPSQLSDELIVQLRGQHLAQSLLYGSAPRAVAHVPPPPGRGRSLARSASRVRDQPPAYKAVPPAPKAATLAPPKAAAFTAPPRVGIVVPVYSPFRFCFTCWDSGTCPATRTVQLLTPCWQITELRESELNVLHAQLRRSKSNKLPGKKGPVNGPLTVTWTSL